MIKFYLYVGLLIVFVPPSKAQQQNAFWLLGNTLGMQFSATNRTTISSENLPMNAPLGSSSFADTATGRLLLYTDGSNVYSGNHMLMQNGTKINGEESSAHSVIVKDVFNPFRFYIISSGTTNATLFYSIVDMSAGAGQGEVVSKRNVLITNADLQFCIVRRYYDMGYWIVTHKAGNNQFNCFSIDSAGINMNPVVSFAGSSSPVGANFVYGKMVSNGKGTEITFTHGQANKDAIAERFSFDKKCGTISPVNSFLGAGIDVLGGRAFAAYSPDDTKLYVNWLNAIGENILVQYDLLSNPVTSFTVFNDNSRFDAKNLDIQLAPDGRMYLCVEVTSLLSVIQNPNNLGNSCDYLHRGVDLLRSGRQQGLYTLNYLPQFMMDVASQPKPFVKPIPAFKDGCEGDTTSFSVQDAFEADSLMWDLGDGTLSPAKTTKHRYAQGGDYPVTFIWYSCRMRYQIMDTVKIRKPSVVNLGNDTVLCHATQLRLNGPVGAESYTWSTGDTARSILVSSKGTYQLIVKSGDCMNEDRVTIDYYSQIWLTLGDEYFICNDDKELVKLDAGERFKQYKWTPTEDTTQWIIVGDVGEYFVVVKDFRGCDGSDGTQVKRRCPVTLYFPNAFTPNGDGLNDYFVPSGKDIVSFTIQLYNRWGQQVFESHSLNTCWDGTFNGVAAPTDMYLYKAQYTGYRNKKLVSFDQKGTVTLMR